MWHPLADFTPTALTWLFMATLIGTVFLFFVLESSARRLRTSAAPRGIASLETAETQEQCRAVINSWDDTSLESARRNLTLDFFFIPLYTTLLAILGVLAAHWFASREMRWMSDLAMLLAWAQWLIALFDVASNSALLRTLQVYPDVPDHLPQMSTWCARLKMLMIGMAVFFGFFGLVSSIA
jgi:hypothetical protein